MQATPIPEVKPLPADTEAAALKEGATYLVSVPAGMDMQTVQALAKSVQQVFEMAGARAILVQEDLKVYKLTQ